MRWTGTADCLYTCNWTYKKIYTQPKRGSAGGGWGGRGVWEGDICTQHAVSSGYLLHHHTVSFLDIWASAHKTYKPCEISEDSDQPARPRSLISLRWLHVSFTVSGDKREPLSNRVEVQADLNLCRSHRTYCRLVRRLICFKLIFSLGKGEEHMIEYPSSMV